MTRQHRNQIAYPLLWNAIAGPIKAACDMHPDIQIPAKRIPALVKRAVGQVLALEARSGQLDETAAGASKTPTASGGHFGAIAGLGDVSSQPQTLLARIYALHREGKIWPGACAADEWARLMASAATLMEKE